MRPKQTRTRRRGGQRPPLRTLVLLTAALKATGLSFSDFLTKRLEDTEVQALADQIVQTGRELHIPVPPSPSALLERLATELAAPPQAPPPELPRVDQTRPGVQDVSGLRPGARYRVFPIGTDRDDDEIQAFDSLTPVYYVGEDDTYYTVKERDSDPDTLTYRIPKESFALSEYDSQDTIRAIEGAPKSPWGGRRRRTVRRRKTLRRKM